MTHTYDDVVAEFRDVVELFGASSKEARWFKDKWRAEPRLMGRLEEVKPVMRQRKQAVVSKTTQQVVGEFHDILRQYGSTAPEVAAYKLLYPSLKQTFDAAIKVQEDIFSAAWKQHLTLSQTKPGTTLQ